ncbi:hypothetical protein BCV72DRAFT_258096 [Rhizopus microsporus var. microsporus]|uniref:Uncharacterized protein n=2 Tax=Rhizopus microsporus TaxID=58291 RepID=A0A2G4T2Y5_RHIZD|nr:uncharacterized protein RHIMIDRAFT_234732 [Rhizopus microsporus ATCC 52813]ORE02846.1 hypothetical protein BCV72DRAFT_258096 [Rhizopus microsporus var. microsporus]PHZ15382.1 hypothetical protein RHIMIDRAFT_234732 [Rhizopus microsporus ATCC 52813]
MNQNEEEEQQQKKDATIFSSIVDVISNATQSATLEFDKFCETIGWKPTQKPVFKHNKRDEPRLSTVKSIHGRILEDRYRRTYAKDAEIQTDDLPEEELDRYSSYKADISSLAVDRRRELYEDEVESERPKKMIKRDTSSPQRTSYVSPIRRFKENRIREPSTSSTHSNNSLSISAPPNQRQSFMESDHDAVRRNSDIVTGQKTVKRLTSELEKKFSMTHPPTFKRPKIESRSESFTPLVNRDVIMDEVRTTTEPSPPPPPPPSSVPEPSAPKNKQSMTASEQLRLEEERMQLLEKKVNDINHQISSFVSPDLDESPIPSNAASPRPMSVSPRTYSPAKPTSSPIFNRNFSERLHISKPTYNSSGSSNSNNNSTPIRNTRYSTSSPVRDVSRMSYTPSPNRDVQSLFRNASSPIPKPTERHISSMRVLIQQIPFISLRKTDIIIGPDGMEKPNPIWHEIYGRKRI